MSGAQPAGRKARVVVVGATGNAGTSVMRALTADPAVGSVLGLARRLPRWCPGRTEWASADITRDDLVPLLRGADVVIHLAWLCSQEAISEFLRGLQAGRGMDTPPLAEALPGGRAGELAKTVAARP